MSVKEECNQYRTVKGERGDDNIKIYERIRQKPNEYEREKEPREATEKESELNEEILEHACNKNISITNENLCWIDLLNCRHHHYHLPFQYVFVVFWKKCIDRCV